MLPLSGDDLIVTAWLVGTSGLLLVTWLGRRWFAGSSSQPEPRAEDPLAGVSVRAQPVLTKQEASFYNLLRLAVQDRFLIFAQVPLWCLVEVSAQDPPARAAFLNKIALKRVDFVLVHPGTLAVEKVIDLDDPSQPLIVKRARHHLMNSIFAAAGIELVRLDAQMQYTVPALASLLGGETMEEP